MAMPMPPPVALAGALNPIEATLISFNSNPYFIGLMMLVLNLGGRHLALGLTPEQDKFFQNPWIRRGLLFVVIFVATRNVITAIWLTVAIVLLLSYLLNEQSNLYLFGEPKKGVTQAAPPPIPAGGLTSDEVEIYKRLHEKATKAKAAEEEMAKEPDVPLHQRAVAAYKANMKAVQDFFD